MIEQKIDELVDAAETNNDELREQRKKELLELIDEKLREAEARSYDHGQAIE